MTGKCNIVFGFLYLLLAGIGAAIGWKVKAA
jgi:hypothetical protein